MSKIACFAALSCLAALFAWPVQAADAPDKRPARQLTVTRTALVEAETPCPPVPAIVARGRRGIGEPGTYYARWDWIVPRHCAIVLTR